MDAQVPFTNRYADLSSDTSYQFEFFCNRCGNGYKSAESKNTVASIGDKATRGLGGMFGGKLSKVASQADAALHSVTDAKTRDKAFDAAVAEVGARFYRCNVCRDWVCEENCWDTEYNLCTTCAAQQRNPGATPASYPPVGQSPQASPAPGMNTGSGTVSGAVAELNQPALEPSMATPLPIVPAESVSMTHCASCHAEVAAGVKFCPECGQAVSTSLTCGKCGVESVAGTKFCPECGNRLVGV